MGDEDAALLDVRETSSDATLDVEPWRATSVQRQRAGLMLASVPPGPGQDVPPDSRGPWRVPALVLAKGARAKPRGVPSVVVDTRTCLACGEPVAPELRGYLDSLRGCRRHLDEWERSTEGFAAGMDHMLRGVSPVSAFVAWAERMKSGAPQ
ncbi:hypothetical protein Mx9_p66 [Myxococcus phage Mx9]|nr:hypothetical protein Mx9_p66 [Myxococcus phage Mx9]